MGIGDVIVLAVSLAILGIWPVVIIYSRFRPDPKPRVGAYESFAGLVRDKNDELWGKLILRDGAMTFTPHDGSAATSIQVHDITNVELISWPSHRIALHLKDDDFEFEFYKYPLTSHAGDEAYHSRRVCNEWKRQVRALGVRIEPDDSWAPMH
jgi:hypothetical protein